MTSVYIAGVGMTAFGKHRDRTLKQLVGEAVELAMVDAGMTPDRVEAAFFGNTVQGALEGQLMVRGQIALRPLGFQGIPIFNVENACASGSSALNLALNYIRAGAADIAIAIGADKMVVADKKAMFGIFDGAWDVSDTVAGRRALLGLGAGVPVPEGATQMVARSFFMDVYAAFAKAHMREFGTTQLQMASVSAKNHQHSAHNPLSQYRVPMTVAEVMAAAPVIWPLTVPMCAPVSDGAAVAILVSERKRQALGIKRSVKVCSSVVMTGIERRPEAFDLHLAAIAARKAYEAAALGPDDIDVAEVHDATAFAEIQQSENLGFCSFGEGGQLAESGATRVGGRIPINPSGGLESRGHPIGATGLAQVHELVTQLRGEAGQRQVSGARLGIAENGGGLYGIEEAVASVMILESASGI